MNQREIQWIFTKSNHENVTNYEQKWPFAVIFGEPIFHLPARNYSNHFILQIDGNADIAFHQL